MKLNVTLFRDQILSEDQKQVLFGGATEELFGAYHFLLEDGD